MAPNGSDWRRPIPNVRFTGMLEGEALASAYRSADVFVFPSKTDTFGLVLLEAMASGLPVAAFPVMGPGRFIGASGCGVLSEDLRQAALDALEIPAQRCVDYAARFGWDESVSQFATVSRAAPAGLGGPYAVKLQPAGASARDPYTATQAAE